MKKFKDLSLEELTNIVNSSKKLRDELDNFIQEDEMNWLRQKLNFVRSSLWKWSLGFFNNNGNFISVRNYEEFLDGVKDSKVAFGASERLEKLINHCEQLLGTNLFEYYAKKLAEVFFEDELMPIINYVEDASFELYQGKVGEKSKDYLEGFFSSYEDYLYDEENKTFYEPHSLSA